MNTCVAASIPIFFDSQTNPLLRDHAFGPPEKKVGLLPGVECLRVATDEVIRLRGNTLPDSKHRVVEIRNIRFSRAIFVPLGEARQMTLQLDPILGKPGYCAEINEPGKQPTDPLTTYVRASILMGRQTSRRIPARDLRKTQRQKGHTLPKSQIYHPLYYPNQGMMAMMGSLIVFADESARAELDTSILQHSESSSFMTHPILPLLLDLGFQATEICTLYLRSKTQHRDDPIDALPVPSWVSRIRFFSRPESIGPEIHIFIRKKEWDHDLEIYDPQTQATLALMTGLRTVDWRNAWRNLPPPSYKDFFGDR